MCGGENCNHSKNQHEIRSKVVDLIEKKTHLQKVYCKDMEIGIFNWSLQFADKYSVNKSWDDKRFIQMYLNKARSVVSNVDKSSYLKNTGLYTRLMNKEFAPHEVAFMDPITLFPEKWREIIDNKLKMEDSLKNNKEIANTDAFKCGKCKSRRCHYTTAQLRSADEPETIFIRCLDCSNNWRIG